MADILTQEEIDALLPSVDDDSIDTRVTKYINLDNDFRDSLLKLLKKFKINCCISSTYEHIIIIKLNNKDYCLKLSNDDNDLGFYLSESKFKYYLPMYFYDIPSNEEALNTIEELLNLIKINPSILIKHLIKQVHYNTHYEKYHRYHFNISDLTYRYSYKPPKMDIVESL